MEQREFEEMIARIRAGDQDAAAELVRAFEPQIRREIRLRLTDVHLRRVVDSMDICQSVLGNFFAKTALGQLEFDRPHQLLRLLVVMARHKVIDRSRHENLRLKTKPGAQVGRPGLQGSEPVAREPAADEELEGREFIEQVRSRLSTQERDIADMRGMGRSWNEIAASLGESAESLRKRLSRACDRVLAEMDYSIGN